MRPDGSLPLETRRGARALWYQRHAIASLVVIAEIAADPAASTSTALGRTAAISTLRSASCSTPSSDPAWSCPTRQSTTTPAPSRPERPGPRLSRPARPRPPLHGLGRDLRSRASPTARRAARLHALWRDRPGLPADDRRLQRRRHHLLLRAAVPSVAEHRNADGPSRGRRVIDNRAGSARVVLDHQVRLHLHRIGHVRSLGDAHELRLQRLDVER